MDFKSTIINYFSDFFDDKNNICGLAIHIFFFGSLLLLLLLEKSSSIIIIMWIADPRLLFYDGEENNFVDLKSTEIKIIDLLVLKLLNIFLKLFKKEMENMEKSEFLVIF